PCSPRPRASTERSSASSSTMSRRRAVMAPVCGAPGGRVHPGRVRLGGFQEPDASVTGMNSFAQPAIQAPSFRGMRSKVP
ncbi:MAG: hypothetical protein LC720_08100, partial [Actinobacteria bacterium]|nr:hypothetical protein [Actinomycetota bacterium]